MIQAKEVDDKSELLNFMPFIRRSGTPSPMDLIIIGTPELISTPPIVAYEPVQFRTTIANVGDENSWEVVFVDVFIDPGIPIPTDMISLPLGLSDGFTAVSHIPAHTSRMITLTAQLGFNNTPENHLVYIMVDSLSQSDETRENNNISVPLAISSITPAATLTPTPTPPTDGALSGIVQIRFINWEPVHRARVFAIAESSTWLRQTTTDANGFYQLRVVSYPSLFTVTACYELDGKSYMGQRTSIIEPDPLANIYLLPGACPY